MRNYGKHLEAARRVQKKLTASGAIGMCFFFIFMFGFYGYSLFFGGFLRWNQVMNETTGSVYTGGQVLTIMFSVMFGAF